jgi:hypothetical protein
LIGDRSVGHRRTFCFSESNEKLPQTRGLYRSRIRVPRQAGAAEDQYSFKVHNTTKDKITKLLASEDGKEYGSFDVGSGIAAGKAVTLN